MADGHGGPRTPLNPAPVSGPGRLSQRTDGPGQKLMAPTGMEYGGQQALLAQERTAPMAQANSITPAAVPTQAPNADQAPVNPTPYQGGGLTAPTARPGEPVTHGVDIGPGGGADAMPPLGGASVPTLQQGPMTQLIQRLSQSGGLTPAMAALYQEAASRGV